MLWIIEKKTQSILKSFEICDSGDGQSDCNRWVDRNWLEDYKSWTFNRGRSLILNFHCNGNRLVWQNVGDKNKDGRNFWAGKTYLPAEIGLVKAVRVRLCSFVRTIKNYDFKKFLPKSTMYTQSASRSLSHNSDRCNRQKSTETLGKLSLKLFANSQRERRCDVCVCVCLWAWCFLIRCVDVAVVEPVVRSIPARKSLYVSHLENRLNILSIRGNKNKFFSFRDLISCFCWERVRAVAFVCVATECWARFCVLKSAISVFSLVYHRRRRRCVLYCCFSRLSVADTPTPFDFVSQKQNSSS